MGCLCAYQSKQYVKSCFKDTVDVFFSEMSAWCQFIHVKLIVAQPVDIPDLYGAQRFTSVFGKNHHWALTWTAEISQQADCVYFKMTSKVKWQTLQKIGFLSRI
jgi:hypothetical protein